jgi:hypothetical protein
MHSTSFSPNNSKPYQSPTYPQRIHIGERRRWQSVLDLWQGRIEQACARLNTIASGPKREPYERLYFQMCGARDQIAEAAARLPMEVDSMYDEDRHRLECAVAALERLFSRWDGGRI